ncbi:MAG: hypothetical protein B2I17_00135 [Thermoplasmatales archaeon B_DKE]|nr:MAG: hypothetical protein B2I17_00135 [Thermoplasmatales archaeon B_DKE]
MYCAKKAAEKLRDVVKVSDKPEETWGMRQEPQMVSETYFLLREKGYKIEELYLEYYYRKVENGNSKRLEADLVFKDDISTHIVEFKVFWNGHVNKNGKLSPSPQTTIREEYSKLRNYSSFDNVAELSLIAAFLGPNSLYHKEAYDNSVMESFDNQTGFKGIRGQTINVIPC